MGRNSIKNLGTKRFLALVLICFFASSATAYAVFLSYHDNPQTINTKPDFLPPITNRGEAIKSEGGIPGYIRSGGTFRVIAQATDQGNPASGITSMQGITTLFNTTLTASPISVAGSTYGYQGPLISVTSGQTTLSMNILAKDALNQQSSKAASIVVDNTTMKATNVEIKNGTGTLGRPDTGDTLEFTFDDNIDLYSVVADDFNWATATAPVQVIIDPPSTVKIVRANGAAMPLTASIQNVNGGNATYVTAQTKFSATLRTIGVGFRVTLGAVSGTNSTVTDTSLRTASWVVPANSGTFDRAGNLINNPGTILETGTADANF